jgi:hypothetical protein
MQIATLGVVVALFVSSGAYAAAQFVASGRVLPFGTDRWNVWTTPGQTRIVVDGDGDTDLDCFVHDLTGRLLGFDDDRTDYCVVTFRRPPSGNVVLEIENLGNVYNEYSVRVE